MEVEPVLECDEAVFMLYGLVAVLCGCVNWDCCGVAGLWPVVAVMARELRVRPVA